MFWVLKKMKAKGSVILSQAKRSCSQPVFRQKDLAASQRKQENECSLHNVELDDLNEEIYKARSMSVCAR